MNLPAVEDGSGVVTQVRGGGWRRAVVQQVTVPGPADHDARLPVTGEEDAQAARVEVELVRLP
ncbi:MAG: hypothetical protein IRY99_22920 [Isosphaeraceae bacterium]|nr:hypothetical protein [Isosphaeraceae bacterium]